MFRVYGVYYFKKYPEWLILCTNLDLRRGYMDGLAFIETGEFDTAVSLNINNVQAIEVGYIYGRDRSMTIKLGKIIKKGKTNA